MRVRRAQRIARLSSPHAVRVPLARAPRNGRAAGWMLERGLAGTVSAAAESNPATPDRGLLTARLDNVNVGGPNVVQIGFDTDQLSRTDGSSMDPKSAELGQAISLTQVVTS